MHEIVTIQLGQCGNQIGNDFWKKICSEHKISADGTLIMQQDDRKDVLFYQSDDSRYIPRAVLIDLEPRVISQCAPLFNKENIYIPNEGGGAGNNWAHGFYVANRCKQEVLENIQKEVEACDSMESFYVMHSVAGGTGSGFGSLIIENLKDYFPKKIVTSYSILPTNQDGSDVVVQPYNSIFALNYLNNFCDNVIVMDNSALGKVTLDSTRIKNISFDLLNSLVSTVLSTYTSTIRFPTHMYCDNRSLLSSTVPVSDFKFLIPSYTPFINDERSQLVRATSVNDVMRRLSQPKSRLCTYESSATNVNLSVFNILEGVKDPKDVSRYVETIFNNKIVNFASGIPPYYLTAISKKKPSFNRVSGLSLKNNSGFSNLLKKICFQFDQLRKRNAFIDMYKKFDADDALFDSSRETIQKVIDNYESLETHGVIL